jgi:hypothetical protein
VRLLTIDLSKKKRIHQSDPRVRGKTGGGGEEEASHHHRRTAVATIHL